MSQGTNNQKFFNKISHLTMRCPKISTIKLVFLSVLSLVTVYLIVFHSMAMRYLKNPFHTVYKARLDHVVVHLDLKGSPPKLSYLKSLLPLLTKYNVNGLLMEYEDMFPYEGKLVNLSARNAYGKEELGNFLRIAINSSIEIIPLVQTFGHLEYALKLPEFKHLRENPQFPDSMCPSKPESIELIREMLDQVISFHEKIHPLKHIHIGCDEVYQLNSCEHCSKRNLTNINLFIAHINEVSRIVKQLSPLTKILIWNDMFKQIIPDIRNRLSFPDMISVYWDYEAHAIFDRGHRMMFINEWLFSGIWVATAFKGADGPAQSLPNMENRFYNHYNWLMATSQYGIGSKTGRYNFQGIVLTGWSRYSHLEPPCELLPVSIPSLMINLILVQKFRTGISKSNMDVNESITHHIQNEFNQVLRCREGNIVFNAIGCQFMGSDLYMIVHKYTRYKEEFSKKIGTELEILKQGYINRNAMPQLEYWCSAAQEKISSLETEMTRVMSKYFDKYSVGEYVAFKLGRMKRDLEQLRLFSNITDIKIWPRRQFNINL